MSKAIVICGTLYFLFFTLLGESLALFDDSFKPDGKFATWTLMLFCTYAIIRAIERSK